jgi:hypothetical protein
MASLSMQQHEMANQRCGSWLGMQAVLPARLDKRPRFKCKLAVRKVLGMQDVTWDALP